MRTLWDLMQAWCQGGGLQSSFIDNKLRGRTVSGVPAEPRVPSVSRGVHDTAGASGPAQLIPAASARRMGRRYRAVWLRRERATCSGVPAATTRPPRSPASGPRSITQSALLMTSRLCSITTTVLPASTSRPRTSSSRRTSSKWRPVVGSSSMYSVRPVSRRPSSRARLAPAAPHPPRGSWRSGPAGDIRGPTSASVPRIRLSRGWPRGRSVRRVHAHLEHVGDDSSLVEDLQRLAVVASALARLAPHVGRRAGSASPPGARRRPGTPRTGRP